MTMSLQVELALSKEQNLTINTESCKRVRYRQNDCHICTDICPEQAITLELGPVINQNCNQCGLCINACPTDAFQNEINFEQYWLDQVQQAANKIPEKVKSKRLNFHCQKAHPADNDSVMVNCIGNINENLLLGSAMMGLTEIVIHTGQCKECHMSKGVLLFNDSLDLAKSLLKSLAGSLVGSLALLRESDNLVVEKIEQPKENYKHEKLSRRDFFTNISQKIKEKTAPVEYKKTHPLDEFISYPEIKTTKKYHPSLRREGLRKILIKAYDNVEKPVRNTELSQWKKMVVEQEKCIACAICINVCPTGALNKTIRNSALFRYFTSALCINCGLCQEACPQEIIHFESNYTLMDLIEENKQLVARVDLNECQICGETIPVIEGNVCTTCQKRQLSPMFIDI